MTLRWLGGTALVALALGGTVVGQGVTAGPGGWDHVGDGGALRSDSLDFNVHALNGDKPNVLLVGGDFTDAGGNLDADRIASWNGSTWSAVGSASEQITNGGVYAIAYANNKVYAGGTFTNAGGDPNADFLAVWDGATATWEPFCGGAQHPFDGNVLALQIIGSTLYVAGAFHDGGGLADADYLVACDLSTGLPSSTLPPGQFFSGSVYALTKDSNDALYAGGGFMINGGDQTARNFAYFAGGVWSGTGTGAAGCTCTVPTFVRSLTAIGTDVYVGTDATNVAGIAQADHVARWSGTAWSAVGANASGADGWFPAVTTIDALTSFGSKLFAGGTFLDAGGDPTADYIVFYDGEAWRPLGSNGSGGAALPAQVSALAIFDRLAAATAPRSLFAGGSFTSAGGDGQANRIASFSLTAITPVATPTVTPGAAPTPVATPVATPAPAAAPTPTPSPTSPPKITALRMASTTFRAAMSGGPFRAARVTVGTTVSFTLSGPGSVRFTIDRSASGRTVKGKCVKPSSKNRSRPGCRRWTAVKGSFTVKGKKGLNKIELRGRIGGRTLKPGRYRLNARGTNSAGQLSPAKRTAFTIVR